MQDEQQSSDDNTQPMSDGAGCALATIFSLVILAVCLGLLAAVIFTVRCAWEVGGA